MAIDHLSELGLSPIEKIQHAREFRVAKWLKEGLSTLAGLKDWSEYNLEEIGRILGWETTARILSARDNLKAKLNLEPEYIRTGDWTCWRCGGDMSLNRPGAGYPLMCTGGCIGFNRRQTAAEPSQFRPATQQVEDAIGGLFGDEIKEMEGL